MTDYSVLPPSHLALNPTSLFEPTPPPAPTQLSLTPETLAALQSHILAAERARQAHEERTRERIKAHGFRLALLVAMLHAPVAALDDSGATATGRGPLNWMFLPPPLVLAPEILNFSAGDKVGEDGGADKIPLKLDCKKATDVMRRIEATFVHEGRGDDVRFLCRGVQGWVAKTATYGALINLSALLLGSHPRLLFSFSSVFLPPGSVLTSRPLSSTTLPPCPQSQCNARSEERKADVESLDPLFQQLSCGEIQDLMKRTGVKLHEGEMQDQNVQPPPPTQSSAGDQMDCDPCPMGLEPAKAGGVEGEDLVDKDEQAEWWAVTYAGAVATAVTRVRRRGFR